MGLFSSLFGSGSKAAYDTRGLAEATNKSNELYKSTYDQALATGAPWLQLGQQGATSLSSQLGGLTTPFNYDQFTADPSYGFLQGEAQKAVERSAAARGSLFAPSTSKALQDRATALASTEYNNAFNRDQQGKQSIYNMLMGVSNVGQEQAAQNAQAGWNYADSVSNNNIGLQNAIRGSYAAKNTATQNMLGNWMNLAGNAASMVAFSDRSLKENIKPYGKRNGFNTYTFNYKGGKKNYIGVLAQEVMLTRPDAVECVNGIYRVSYHKLGLSMVGA